MTTPDQAALLKAAYGRKHKFGAKRTEVDGVSFASKREAERYAELKLLEKAGAIKNLRLQPEYPLTVNGVRIGAYRADFEYVERLPLSQEDTVPAWVLTAEDVKGFMTPLARWKLAHFAAEYKSIRLVVSK